MNHRKVKAIIRRLEPSHPEEKKYYRQHFFRYCDCLNHIPASYIEGKFVVDIGAIPGHLTRAVKCLGASKVIGVDYDPERFGFRKAFAGSGIPLLQCDIRTSPLPFDAETVDMILFTEVIEHIPDPSLAISEMFRVLKSSGKIIITTPNVGNLANRIRRLLRLSIFPARSLMGNKSEQSHVHEYYKNELQSLFTNARFKVIKSNYLAGTEKTLIFNKMPMRLPWLFGALYGLCVLPFPPLRSYLFFILGKP